MRLVGGELIKHHRLTVGARGSGDFVSAKRWSEAIPFAPCRERSATFAAYVVGETESTTELPQHSTRLLPTKSP